MRFYGIAKKDNSTGKNIKRHLFRDRELALHSFETLKKEVKKNQSLIMFSRSVTGSSLKAFAEIFEASLASGEWDEKWIMEEDYIPSHPVTIDNGQMLDLLSDQLDGVLRMALLAEVDIKVLLDHTLAKNEVLRENYQK